MNVSHFWTIMVGIAQCLRVDVDVMGMLGRRRRSIMGKTVCKGVG